MNVEEVTGSDSAPGDDAHRRRRRNAPVSSDVDGVRSPGLLRQALTSSGSKSPRTSTPPSSGADEPSSNRRLTSSSRVPVRQSPLKKPDIPEVLRSTQRTPSVSSRKSPAESPSGSSSGNSRLPRRSASSPPTQSNRRPGVSKQSTKSTGSKGNNTPSPSSSSSKINVSSPCPDKKSPDDITTRIESLTAIAKETVARVDRLTSSSSLFNASGSNHLESISNLQEQRIRAVSTSSDKENHPESDAAASASEVVLQCEEYLGDEDKKMAATATRLRNCKFPSNSPSPVHQDQFQSQIPVRRNSTVINNCNASGIVENGNQCVPEPEQEAECDIVNGDGSPERTSRSSKRPSILKKKSFDEQPTSSQHPISILKRKSSHDEGGRSASPPVTAQESAARRHSILKKRSSLDESGSRSGSPDLHGYSSEFRPILRSRRSSLENGRTQSPEPQSILKRKSSREEVEGRPYSPEPQSILKRKSSGNISVDGLSEGSLEPRPILKKKSSSEELDVTDPKPILKKKQSSTDDEQDDKLKPILKTRRSLEGDATPGSSSCNEFEDAQSNLSPDEDVPSAGGVLFSRSPDEGRPVFTPRSSDDERLAGILKNRDSSSSPVRSTSTAVPSDESLKSAASVRPRCDSVPESSDLATNIDNYLAKRVGVAQTPRTIKFDEMDPELTSVLRKRRSLASIDDDDLEDARLKEKDATLPTDVQVPSVAELVLSMERSLEEDRNRRTSKGRRDRTSDRFRTQPITLGELQESDSLETVQAFRRTIAGDRSSEDGPGRVSLVSKLDPISDASPLLTNGIGEHHEHLSETADTIVTTTCVSTTVSSTSEESMGDSSVFNSINATVRETSEAMTSSPKHAVEEVRGVRLKPEEDGDEKVFGASADETTKLSVQERAQLFEKEKQTRKEAKMLKAKGGAHILRYKERKERFGRGSTQPVTTEEVHEAARLAEESRLGSPEGTEQTDGVEKSVTESSDGEEPSKLTLAERVRLFNQKIIDERLPQKNPVPEAPPLRRRSSRFQTQPVTTDEVQKARRISPLAASLTKPPDPEILGNVSARVYREKAIDHAATILMCSPVRKEGVTLQQDETKQRKGILKQNVESVSGDESSSVKKAVQSPVKETKESSDELESFKRLKRVMRRETDPSAGSNTSSTEATTDDTDTTSSSGGQEVQRIIRNEAVARRRRATQTKQKDRLSYSELKTYSSNESHSIAYQEINGSKTSTRSSTKSGVLNASRNRTLTQCDEEEAAWERRGLQRSRTQPLTDEEQRKAVAESMSKVSIAERLAALQKNGETGWKSRLGKLKNDNPEIECRLVEPCDQNGNIKIQIEKAVEKSPPGGLKERLGRLDAAQEGWKQRVAGKDAVQFTVAGRLERAGCISPLPVPSEVSPNFERKKKTPRPVRFRCKTTCGLSEIPPAGNATVIRRSISAPEGGGQEDAHSESDSEGKDLPFASSRIAVPRPDDDNFSAFFSTTSSMQTEERVEIHDDAFDSIVSQSRQLLVQKKNVRMQRRKGASGNPLRSLAQRIDLQSDYEEVRTGVAEKELKRLRVEKLAQNSTLAVEALAGLASKEDFTAVSLKKAGSPNASLSSLQPFKDLMLLQVKGRRHVQTRLVEPSVHSINSGDNYILVTPTEVYNWIGEYSNVIERSKAAELSLLIHQRKDLGCNTDKVITIEEGKTSGSGIQAKNFWSLLGASPSEIPKVLPRGNPDCEDELYESAIVDTNMVYELEGEELVPCEKYWGSLPKIEMLDPKKVLVFDFGAELYVWNGKTATSECRKNGVRLVKELWEEGYDYSECDICPLTGFRGSASLSKSGARRPSWALLGKVNQHMETLLFREKFLDWPDFSRVIRMKGEDKETNKNAIRLKLEPCDITQMLENKPLEPDLELEGSHLGRGRSYEDKEERRYFQISTQSVKVWHVEEFQPMELPEASWGQFHSGDTYIVRWQYTVMRTGRELNGEISRHSAIGRTRCAYFYWQGKNVPSGELGAGALLTVELDEERSPQIRLAEGSEPPAFLNLFGGGMVVYRGSRTSQSSKASKKKLKNRTPLTLPNPKLPLALHLMLCSRYLKEESTKNCGACRLFLCRGETENEAVLVEVPCSARHLRSRGCFVMVNKKTGVVHLWHGAKSLRHSRQVASAAVKQMMEKCPKEIGLHDNVTLSMKEFQEGDESRDFFEGLGGGGRQLYMSLLNSKLKCDNTPRLFHMTSWSGTFEATEVLCPHRIVDRVQSIPFVQDDLYAATQPALFVLEDADRLWLWQGWFPEAVDESDNAATGSRGVRWQAERRAAMQTALKYWHAKRGESVPPKVLLVWAGLEPLEFTNLFALWQDRDDVAELNMEEGLHAGEIVEAQEELARLTCDTYPPAVLLQRPLPDGVDPTQLELYLSEQHFQELLGMSKEDFLLLPSWRQTSLKKEVGLF